MSLSSKPKLYQLPTLNLNPTPPLCGTLNLKTREVFEDRLGNKVGTVLKSLWSRVVDILVNNRIVSVAHGIWVLGSRLCFLVGFRFTVRAVTLNPKP